MNPTLPGALIEREKICDLCDCPTAEWEVFEMRGSLFTLCGECQDEHAGEIAEEWAKADAAGREEDEAQEGE